MDLSWKEERHLTHLICDKMLLLRHVGALGSVTHIGYATSNFCFLILILIKVRFAMGQVSLWIFHVF